MLAAFLDDTAIMAKMYVFEHTTTKIKTAVNVRNIKISKHD